MRLLLVRELAAQPYGGLVVDLGPITPRAERVAQLLGGQPLHADEEPAATRAAAPLVDEIVDQLPAAEIEVADAEVAALGYGESVA